MNIQERSSPPLKRPIRLPRNSQRASASPPDFSKIFDRVVFLNLARRQDRLERFEKLFVDWPFTKPQRFEAIDGSTVEIPSAWRKGVGAWGCMLSHRAIMQAAIKDGVSSLVVLEDDARLVPNFSKLAGEFLSRVPKDWDCLMFGGEHLRRPIPVGTRIVRCMGTNRTHAFALRGSMMPILLEFWKYYKNEHCDIVLASLMRHFKVYAPDPFLIGQDAGFSDITESDENMRFLLDKQVESFGKEDLPKEDSSSAGTMACTNPATSGETPIQRAA